MTWNSRDRGQNNSGGRTVAPWTSDRADRLCEGPDARRL